MGGMDRRRIGFVWTGLDAPRMEYADLRLSEDGLMATGVQIGVEPAPYLVQYELRTDEGMVAASFDAASRTPAGERRLRLVRTSDGGWHKDGAWLGSASEATGEEELNGLAGALDVDLGYSPVFNSTPVLRDRLHRAGAESQDYLMAWVSVPDLNVSASRQRYEPLGREGEAFWVRYTSLDSGFTARIAFDEDGFVVHYEDFLRRIGAERPGDG
jgi:hypothetical protein